MSRFTKATYSMETVWEDGPDTLADSGHLPSGEDFAEIGYGVFLTDADEVAAQEFRVIG